MVYKLKSNGDTIWVRVINTLQIISMTSSNDVGCVITGETRNPPNPSYPFILKLDSNGNTVWLKYYQQGIIPNNIIKTLDGGYVVCGKSPSFDPGYGFVLKTDSLGKLQWLKNYIINFTTRFNSTTEAQEGGFLISGFTAECSGCTGYSFILKVNVNGDSININEYSYSEYTKIINIKGGYLIGASFYDTTVNYAQILFFKINQSGKLYFQSDIKSYGREILKDIKIINENRYVIVSDYDTLNKRVGGVYIVDSLGNVLHRNIFDYNSWDFCILSGVMPFDNGDIGFIGTARLITTPNWQDIFVARTDSTLYSKPIGIKNINSFIFDEYKLYQNYPNPFNPSTKIKVEVPFNTSTIRELKIFDALGREFQKFDLSKNGGGTYEIEFNAEKLSSGIYFYSLIIDNKIFQTRKMILIR